MPWYPDAIRKPVERYKPGGSSHQPMPNPGRFCLHTAVSSGDSLFALFNRPGNPVAHFYVRDDGKIEQYVDTDTRASANLEGNPDTIAVESWDAGGTFRILGTVEDIIPRARQIAEGDWFDMATKAELREVVDAALDAKVDEIAGRVKKSLLDETDLFPNNPDIDVTVRTALARVWTHAGGA